MPELISGRYEPIALLGSGASARVHLVQDRVRGGPPLALKRVAVQHPGLALAEFRRLRTLRHPGIPAAGELGLDPLTGETFFTSEVARGEDFVTALAGWPLNRKLEAIADLLRTLALLDDRGVVHRDLKPANLRVEHRNEPRVRVIDFGLATGGPSAQPIAGSLPYLAPELCTGAPATHRSDLYSLGIVLFETFAGRHPLRADSPLEWARAHCEQPVAFPSGCDVPPAIAAIILRLLAKRPEDRPGHAREVLADLSRGSAVPLPRSTPRTLLSRIRSPPRFDPPWDARAEPVDAPAAGSITWVTATTRAGRDELMRDLRASAIADEAFPLVVTFAPEEGALAPRAALLAQLRALEREAEATPAVDAALLEALRSGRLSRRATLFVEEADARTEADDALLRFLLRTRVETIASSARRLRDDATVTSALRGNLELRELEPRPLAREEVEREAPAWLGGALPPDLARWIGLDARIDAPRLVETLSYLAESGALQADDEGIRFDASRVDRFTPGGDAFELARRRIARCEGERRRALEALAVWDSDADPAELEALAPGLSTEALDDLVAAGLVTRSGESHRCASGVIAALVRASLPEARARELELAAARRLASAPRGADVELRRARHAFRAEPGGEGAEALAREAVELLLAARIAVADAAARELSAVPTRQQARLVAQLVRGAVEQRRGSHAAAEELLRPLAGTLSDPRMRALAILEHARALDRCERTADALALLEAHPELDRLLPGARAQRAFFLLQLRRDAEAEAACREALGQEEHDPEFQRFRVVAMRAIALWRLERIEEARAAFEEAIAEADSRENPLARASIENNFARFEEDCGRLAAAHALFRRSLATTTAFGDRQQEAGVAQNLAQTLYDLGRYPESKIELQRAREIAHAMHRPAILRRIALQQAQIAMNEGDLDAAASAVDESARIADEAKDPAGRWLADLVRSEILLRRGSVGQARRLLRELEDSDPVRRVPELPAYLAEYRLLFESFCGSRMAVARALDRMPDAPRSTKRRAQIHGARLRALARLGDRSRIEAAAASQLAELSSTEFAPFRAQAAAMRCVAARLAGDRQPPRDLEAEARGALGEVRAPGHSIWRAEIALALGAALEDARLLEDAERIARRLSHAPLIRRAARARRRVRALAGAAPEQVEELARLTRLKEVAKRIGATTDGEELLRFVLDHAIEATRARRGFLILARGGDVSVRAARNLDAADIEKPELAFSSSVARVVAGDGRPALLCDVSADERFRHSSSISQLKLLSLLCVPLIVRGEVIGSIYLDDPTRIDAFGDTDLSYMEELSAFAAIALDKADLLHSLRERQRQLERSNEEIVRLNRELQQALLENHSELKAARAAVERTRRQAARALDFEGIVAHSAVMEEVKRKIELFADSDLPVFVSGESGTGKELVARALHRKSARRSKPYGPLNCATMQPSLIENELFGHLRGAFTGANEDRPGLLERLDGGTLFLDEVGDASPELQAKLLRVVQTGEVQRLGGGEIRTVDVRIIAASNKDVPREVEAGRFREDLRYRLQVLEIHLPPLRDRRDDIPLLIEHFERSFCGKLKARPLNFSTEAWKRFITHSWPGNVRELENAVQRLLVLHREGEEIGLEALAIELPRAGLGDSPETETRLRDFIDRQEREFILRALALHGGNRLRTAGSLGISARNLYQKLQRHGITGGGDPDREGDVDGNGDAG